MITKIFLIQLMLTFLIGSCWIYFTVLAGLRLGSKTGGFIGGLPSTALLSYLFIGFTQSHETAASSSTVFPLAMALTSLFLVVFASISRKGFLPALLGGIVTWFLISAFIVFFRWENFLINLLIYAMVSLFSFLMLEKYLKIKSVSNGKTKDPEKHLAIRSVFGGIIVILAVLVAKKGGPVLGGLFSAFPAMFISTLTISYKAHGIEFSRAMTKPLLVTGMITIAVYAIALRNFYPATGLYAGTLIAVCISAVSACQTFRFILPKLK